MVYKLLSVNGYDMVKIDSYLFMIDTGSPTVFFNRKLDRITINNKEIRGMMLNMPNEQQISSFGMIVDGFIGQDTMKKFGCFEIDRINKTVNIGSISRQCINPIRMNGDIFEVKINGVKCRAHLDTGAPIIGVKNLNVLQLGTFVTNNHIENTFRGPQRTSLYKGTIEFNGVIVENDMFHLTERFNQDGSDAFFALNNLAQKYYVIDYRNSVLYFE